MDLDFIYGDNTPLSDDTRADRAEDVHRSYSTDVIDDDDEPSGEDGQPATPPKADEPTTPDVPSTDDATPDADANAQQPATTNVANEPDPEPAPIALVSDDFIAEVQALYPDQIIEEASDVRAILTEARKDAQTVEGFVAIDAHFNGGVETFMRALIEAKTANPHLTAREIAAEVFGLGYEAPQAGEEGYEEYIRASERKKFHAQQQQQTQATREAIAQRNREQGERAFSELVQEYNIPEAEQVGTKAAIRRVLMGDESGRLPKNAFKIVLKGLQFDQLVEKAKLEERNKVIAEMKTAQTASNPHKKMPPTPMDRGNGRSAVVNGQRPTIHVPAEYREALGL